MTYAERYRQTCNWVIEMLRLEFPGACEWSYPVKPTGDVEILDGVNNVIGYIASDEWAKMWNSVELQ